MSNTVCAVSCDKTLGVIGEMARLTKARSASAQDLGMTKQELVLTIIESDGGTWRCAVLPSLESPIHFNPENGHLQLRIRDRDREIPLVIEGIDLQVEDQESPLPVRIFPVHLGKLMRRRDARVAA